VWRCGGSKDGIKEGKTLVEGLVTMLEVGVDESDVEAEAKRVSRVTFLLLGVGAGEADGMSLENK
jgi:hypothetical protein